MDAASDESPDGEVVSEASLARGETPRQARGEQECKRNPFADASLTLATWHHVAWQFVCRYCVTNSSRFLLTRGSRDHITELN